MIRSGEGAVDLAARVLQIGMALAVTGVVVQTTADLVNFWALDLSIEALKADSDASAFTWASTVATFTAAVGALLLALLGHERSGIFFFLAAVTAFLSFDDMLTVHERAGALVDRLGDPPEFDARRLLWVAIFSPLLAGLLWALWRVARESPPGPRRWLKLGAVLLVAAVMLELTSPALLALGYGGGSVPYEFEVVAEEGAELAGWILIASGLFAKFVLSLSRGEANATRGRLAQLESTSSTSWRSPAGTP
jgi:hypothetical protein